MVNVFGCDTSEDMRDFKLTTLEAIDDTDCGGSELSDVATILALSVVVPVLTIVELILLVKVTATGIVVTTDGDEVGDCPALASAETEADCLTHFLSEVRISPATQTTVSTKSCACMSRPAAPPTASLTIGMPSVRSLTLSRTELTVVPRSPTTSLTIPRTSASGPVCGMRPSVTPATVSPKPPTASLTVPTTCPSRSPTGATAS